MNHRPFEERLLSEKPLTPEENHLLQEHLHDCTECNQLEAGLAEVQQLFCETPQASPAPGFTARWQARVAEQQRQKQQLQSWLLLAFLGNSAMILLAALISQTLGVLKNATQILLLRATAISIWLSLTEFVRETAASLGDFLAVFPLGWMLSILGAGGLLCVLWFATFQQLTSARRISR